MHDILYGLLGREEPRVSSVIGHKTAASQDLALTEIRYIQDGRFCAAAAYHTDCWICKSPLGPQEINQNLGRFQCAKLHDVAEISHYATLRELDSRPWPQPARIMEFQRAINLAADKAVRKQWPALDKYIHRVTFRYTPTPAMLVLCVDKENHDALIGTLSIDIVGQPKPLAYCSDKIFEILSAMRGNALPPITEDIIYEQDG